MFNKLRLNFILINMSLLTTVFIGIFGTIFAITNINIQNEINRELQALMHNDHKLKPFTAYMIVNIDNTRNEINVVTPFDTSIDDDSLREFIDVILAKEESSSKININETKYSYLKQPTTIGEKIVLIDITSQQNTILLLLRSFVLVGAISLIVLLLISIYLTNKTLKPVKDTFDKQKQFIADASHELKTPLAIIKTNTSLVLDNPEDSIKNQSKWINYISLQADRMSELVNEMLSLAKLDAENTKIELYPINISNIVEGMLLGFDAVIYESGINLEDNISEDIIVNGYEEGIKKLFSILMDNAIKYTDKNGTISVSIFKSKNKVKMIIKNTGKGIEKQHLDKIFERFYRDDNSRVRETGGYGLGLSIAQSIVTQHKGKIYAQSNLGENTTFIVELPQ